MQIHKIKRDSNKQSAKSINNKPNPTNEGCDPTNEDCNPTNEDRDPTNVRFN